MKIQLTPLLRISLLALQVIILMLLPFWLLKVVHYMFWPIPSLFSSPSLIPTEENAIKNWQDINLLQTVSNLCIYMAFWIQHIVMSSFKWKSFIIKFWPLYLFYERLIYNIASSIFIYYALDAQVPQNYVIFAIPWAVCIPLTVIGLWLYLDSNLQLKESVIVPYSFTGLMSDKYLQRSNVQQVQSSGIFVSGSYRFIRHPMQCGFFLFQCFGNSVFTFEKCVFLIVYLVIMVVGVLLEQKRLIYKFSEYPNYMKQVRARFIPYLI